MQTTPYYQFRFFVALAVLATGTTLGVEGAFGGSKDRSVRAVDAARKSSVVDANVAAAVQSHGSKERIQGCLAWTDGRLGGGELYDVHEFAARRGDALQVSLSSSQFDSYLMLTSPGGLHAGVGEAGKALARLEVGCAEPGRYTVTVTSVGAGQMGDYELEISRNQGSAEDAVVDAGEVYGLFVGISDYAGRLPALHATARDALTLYDSFVSSHRMRAENGIVLTNSKATRQGFERELRLLGERAGPADTVVLFYSGHGGRQERSGEFQIQDPDGVDETLELFDTAIGDDELAALMGSLRAGCVLVFLDSCYAGGFAKDLITRPGRMGVFSSEEDVPSAVARHLDAGGYLSAFLRDGIGSSDADSNRDGAIAAMELRSYLAERYRKDVRPSRAFPGHAEVSAQQRLVIDGAAISTDHVLF